MADRVVLAQGEGCECDAAAMFGREAFERVFISYALSMIPDWQGALRQAARCVADGGKLEVVDFGKQARLPTFWQQALCGWMARFHVEPRAALCQAFISTRRKVGKTWDMRCIVRE